MFKFNKKNKISANPSPTFDKPEFPKRESKLPLPKNKVPMPECKQYMESKVMLEKKIRFNNKDWLIKIDDNYFEVFIYNNDGEISRNNIFRGCACGETLIDKWKYMVKHANDILFSIDDIEEFNKWDGNMDKELNKV
jgi:hypothetical protein